MSTSNTHTNTCHTRQQGVVLIVSLILLMVLSLLASISIRGASSNEQVANQTRQRTLARQTAEAALLFCEQQVQLHDADATQGFAPQAYVAGSAPTWQNMSNWDAISAVVNPFVGTGALKTVPITASGDVAVGGAAPAVSYFSRAPECMSQFSLPGNTKVFVTTARGFGPEVPAVKDGNPPRGTEVWLQSTITMQ